jgi:hypothetical protein
MGSSDSIRAAGRIAACLRVLGIAILTLFCWLYLTGCATSLSDPIIGRGFKPRNIHAAAPELPPAVRRVAVLPLTGAAGNIDLENSRESLTQALNHALHAEHAFELAPVSADQLQHWFGKALWTAHEPLPQEFLERLRDRLDCDGVLFVHVSAYRAYAPILVGWNLKLVGTDTPAIWWSADAIFNSGDPSVARAARRYHQRHFADASAATDSKLILNSPAAFTEYTLHALFQTLPDRK